MGISAKEIVTGRKIFFITPDTSLIPETYLEEYFALGYECYFIENDKRVSIIKKLDIILSLFKDVIIFFNIDYHIEGIEWQYLIKNLIDLHHNKESIGVLYTKRQTKEERMRREQKYLYEMGIACGCIQLEYQKKQNFEIIEKILYANQAQGRRKSIRALCTSACTYSFRAGPNTYNGSLQDISVSHFSLLVTDGSLKVQLYEKIQDFHFNIRGFLFRSDAVLIMQRQTPAGLLMVFAFTSTTGANGLDERIKQLLIPNIYKLMSSNCMNLLEQIFSQVDADIDPMADLQEVDD